MRHAKPYRKLSRQRSHYRALMRNLALGLFENERIVTTLAKAKEVRRFVDSIITLAKAGGMHDRRRAFALMGNKTITTSEGTRDPLQKVFTEFSKRYESRPGGYTRIIKLGYRPGDAAPKAILELVDAKPLKVVEGDKEEKAPKKKSAVTTKAKTKTAKSKAKKEEAA